MMKGMVTPAREAILSNYFPPLQIEVYAERKELGPDKAWCTGKPSESHKNCLQYDNGGKSTKCINSVEKE